MEGQQEPKETLLPYIERLLGGETADFVTYYASRETQTPFVLPLQHAERSADRLTLQAQPELSEGLDLEARRARDIIRRGLAIVPERLRDIAASKGEET
jgi:hypothetical protein